MTEIDTTVGRPDDYFEKFDAEHREQKVQRGAGRVERNLRR